MKEKKLSYLQLNRPDGLELAVPIIAAAQEHFRRVFVGTACFFG